MRKLGPVTLVLAAAALAIGVVSCSWKSREESTTDAEFGTTQESQSDSEISEHERRARAAEILTLMANIAQKRLQEETPDIAWSTSREHDLERGFSYTKLPGFRLASAKCAATICKVVIMRSPEAKASRLAPALLEQSPFREMGVFFHYEADRVTLYATREGKAFPTETSAAPAEPQATEHQ